MPSPEDFNHQVRRTAITTLALAAGLVFGIVVLAGGDWIPGGIIVAARVVGLAAEIPVIRKLCTDWPPSPPKSKPVS
jgi:class 3 adenylate cyclase